MSEASHPGRAGATTSSIRLYTQSMNPFSERVAAALGLKGLPFERVVSDDPEDVRRWSPIARTLPVLEIDGRRKADSPRILEWLDTLHPDPPLYALDPKTASAQRSLADWTDSSLLFYWNRWRAARYPRPGDDRPVDDSLLARLRDQIARPFGRTPRTRAEARELEIIQQLVARLDDLEGFLRDRPFFHADEPSGADVAVYAMLRVLRAGTIPHCADALAARARLVAYLERMESRIRPLEARTGPVDGDARDGVATRGEPFGSGV
ncbi:MAG: glutathione S-transferase family protein [Spirochaetaceae bacterium]|nr:glutathione S-transferase family protein [Myxococcales bacterium]MCB9726188.1 glutathione S-transferase family protein [Spirochaetaceae bacterium]HPG25841.1 glutathione S-transferase family protein [Myxococcota bacterium]